MTYVYMARSGPFVKIGISKNPHSRLLGVSRESKRPCSQPVVLVHATRGSYQDEQDMHSALAPYRVSSEWYRGECLSAPELKAFLGKPAECAPEYATISIRCSPAFKKLVRRAAIDMGVTLEEICLLVISKLLNCPLPEETSDALRLKSMQLQS